MTQTAYKLAHFPDIPCKPFEVFSDDLEYLARTCNVLAEQHLFLFDNRFIPDYTNALVISERIPESDMTDEDRDYPWWDMMKYEVAEVLARKGVHVDGFEE